MFSVLNSHLRGRSTTGERRQDSEHAFSLLNNDI